MRTFLSVLATFAFTDGCLSTDDEVVRTRCEELRDHVVELRLGDMEPRANPYLESFRRASVPSLAGHAHSPGVPPVPVIDRQAHRAAMQRALGDAFVTSCVKSITHEQLSCALEAKTSSTAAACYHSEGAHS